ncbi:MAG: hypothetical protein H6Q69_12 [Firmicutes bacterium]|nr:hypothetical protein [Bacillota bacterium]
MDPFWILKGENCYEKDLWVMIDEADAHNYGNIVTQDKVSGNEFNIKRPRKIHLLGVESKGNMRSQEHERNRSLWLICIFGDLQ